MVIVFCPTVDVTDLGILFKIALHSSLILCTLSPTAVVHVEANMSIASAGLICKFIDTFAIAEHA